MIGVDLFALPPAARTKARIAFGMSSPATAVALALLWKRHRVAGALIGLFLLGPLVGAGVAYAAIRGDLKALEEADRKRLSAGGFRVGDKIRGRDATGKTQAGVVDQVDYTGPGSKTLFVRWADGSSSIASESDAVKS